ncbi:MAG: hypothetical protein U0514_00575 [Candidatus Andersenbacteria bacterium]
MGASAAQLSPRAQAIPQTDLALEALVELGYSDAQARAALADITEDSRARASVERSGCSPRMRHPTLTQPTSIGSPKLRAT